MRRHNRKLVWSGSRQSELRACQFAAEAAIDALDEETLLRALMADRYEERLKEREREMASELAVFP